MQEAPGRRTEDLLLEHLEAKDLVLDNCEHPIEACAGLADTLLGACPATLAKLYRALPRLEQDAPEEAEYVMELLTAVKGRCQLIGVRRFAKRARVDGANLAKVLSGRRRPGEVTLAKFETALHERP